MAFVQRMEHHETSWVEENLFYEGRLVDRFESTKRVFT